ncbi:MAG: hypothetical protein AUJ55_05520 [Proteobacteria bacterium CG1_02_64_396]|nr:MAG: hypothetical protein AUJ55_05520 [Proteobacteria bacterium CG1_02_64_396]
MSRPSNIDLLPAEIREALHAWLRSPEVTQTQALDRLNTLLHSGGYELRVSRSGLNRYAQRMEEVGARVRQSREIAQMWVERLGVDRSSDVGRLTTEMAMTTTFEVMQRLQDVEMTEETVGPLIEQLNNLSLTIQRLERSASESIKREKAIREEARKQAQIEAADIFEREAKAAGASLSLVEKVRRELGVL